jgi:histidinol-phosphatase
MATNPDLEFALDVARSAESSILPRYQNCEVSLKSDGTEVTVADREAEQVIRRLIEGRFPDDGILGEEQGESQGSTNRVWVIDPVDGTASFTLGIPLFGTLIALLEDRRPVVGVVHFPALGETVYAARGEGCWFRKAGGDPMRVRVDPCPSVSHATITSCCPHSSDIQCEPGQTPYQLSAVIKKARKFRFGGDCMLHALVARGRAHAAIDTIMSPWDIAALVPCVEEAGGIATSVIGDPTNVVFGGSLLTSSHATLHAELVAMLAPRAGRIN